MRLRAIHNKANASGFRQKGFTIVEILIVIAILGILGVAIMSFFTNITRKSSVERTIATTQQKARIALEMMARDVRMMGLDPTRGSGAGLWTDSSDPFGYSPAATGSDFLAFSADLNYDGDVEDPFERIAYYIDGDELIMETFVLVNESDDDHNAAVTRETFSMLNGLQPGDLVFRYFGSNNAEITPAANASLNSGQNLFAVEITLNVRAGSPKEEIERSYSTIVRLRNR